MKTMELSINAAGKIMVGYSGFIHVEAKGKRYDIGEVLYQALPERLKEYTEFHGTICVSIVEDPEFFEVDNGGVPVEQASAFNEPKALSFDLDD